MSDTLLVISGVGIPQWSARGLSQKLTPIDGATNLDRDVNGGIVDLSNPDFRKFATEITCTDMRTPVFDSIWPGAGPFTVDCVAELVYASGGTPSRTVVPGSTRTEGTNVFYRPRLSMTVTAFNWQLDEWGGAVGWTLALEES